VGAAGGGAALAVASVPDSSGVIHACVATEDSGAPVTTGANVRIVDPSKGQACDTTTAATGAPPSETNLTWNQQGPTGSQGARGARGRAITIAGGNTLTLQGGNVVTVGSSRGVTINSPPLRLGGKPLATLKLDFGGSSMTFDVFSWSVPGTTHSGGTGAGSGKVATHEFVITKKIDKASPKLALYCANGKHIVRATLTVRKAGKPQAYLVIKLDQILISSYQTGGSGGGNSQPVESLSLNFTKVHYDYNPSAK
jgi:type VI secretion system secreted protein Hcp